MNSILFYVCYFIKVLSSANVIANRYLTNFTVDGFSPPHLTDINMRKFPNFASCLRIAHSLSKPESDIWGRLSFKIEQEQKFR
jgi:hypothetical protein